MWRLAGPFHPRTSLPMNWMMLPLSEICGEATMKWMGCPVIREQRRAQFIACLPACLPDFLLTQSVCQSVLPVAK